MTWRIVTVKFPRELLRQLDELARRLKVKRSKIIRLAVEDYINGKNGKKIRCPLCGRIVDLDEYYSKHYPKEDDP